MLKNTLLAIDRAVFLIYNLLQCTNDTNHNFLRDPVSYPETADQFRDTRDKHPHAQRTNFNAFISAYLTSFPKFGLISYGLAWPSSLFLVALQLTEKTYCLRAKEIFRKALDLCWKILCHEQTRASLLIIQNGLSDKLKSGLCNIWLH